MENSTAADDAILSAEPDNQVQITLVIAHAPGHQIEARFDTLTLDGFDYSDTRPQPLPSKQGLAFVLGWFPKDREFTLEWDLRTGDTDGVERLLFAYYLDLGLARRRVIKWLSPEPFSQDAGSATIHTRKN